MPERPDYTIEIAALEYLINSATESVTADGLSTKFNLDHAKKQLAALRRLQGDDLRMVRPRVVSVDIGSCW